MYASIDAVPRRAPSRAPQRRTANVWPVIGTGVKGSGMAMCAISPVNRLNGLGEFGETCFERIAGFGPHVPDLPLRPPAEAQVGDVEELFEIHGEGQVRRRRIRQQKTGVLGGNAGLERLVVQLADAAHEG